MINFASTVILSFVSNLPSVNPIQQSLIGHNSSRRGVHITLIGWRWDVIGRYLVVLVFFLLGAFAKIAYHNTQWLRNQVPESCVLILLGSFVGLILHLTDIPGNTYIPQFTPEKFFYFYLPPIILESAFELFDKTFFKNIGTIMLLAVVRLKDSMNYCSDNFTFYLQGTIINIIGIGISIYVCSNCGLYLPFRLSFIECLTFSTLISAVDPVAVIAIFQEVNVDKALYFLVFGESLLNDAVVVTMYNTMTNFAAATDIQVKHVFLAILSFITVSVIEPLVVMLCAYLSYFTAELLHFSGIICLTCCGLIQAAYARHNISSKSNITIKYFVKTLSSISEVIIFLFLGMVLIRDIHTWNFSFVISVLIFCIIYRFASIYLLTYVCNNFSNRLRSITRQEQFIMAYGGLRGAIAFALAIMLDPRDLPSADLFVTATLTVIIFTVFVQGSTTKPIVQLLGLQMLTDADPKLFNELHLKVIETTMNGLDDIIGQSGAGNFIAKSLYNVNKSARRFLIKDYTNRWTTVRQTVDMIELNQLKSVFTMVKSIPDKHSAGDLISSERYVNSLGRKMPNKKYPKAPKAISFNSVSPRNQNSNNSNHVNFSKLHSNLKGDSSSKHHFNVKALRNIDPRTVNKTNGVSPFADYHGKITYVKPKEFILAKQSRGQQLESQPNEADKSSGASLKILKTRFSSDSNISCFRETLNETFGHKVYPELNTSSKESSDTSEEITSSKGSN
uniref:Sodium/hydrogen exchanger n=1 Tax=Tetranychus urticae TaxID=32264 RepID=T1KSG4_TETUR